MVTTEREWHLLDVVGRGGFGTVYRAREVGPGGFTRIVAVKTLHAEGARVPGIGARLRDEARLLGLLRHRAIVHVDGLVALGDGGWAVVMEYIEGASLGELVERHGRLPIRAALEIVAEVASALHVATNTCAPDATPLRVQHRDVKPTNVIVTPAGEVKLLDFGIAQAAFAGREAETRSMTFGSIDYMSPERLTLAGGPPADMYSLGAVLVEVLTAGRFGRASLGEAKHRERLGRAADQVEESTRVEGVADLVRSMLAFDEADRPTAREVATRCIELARSAPDDSVADWAERAVGEVLRLRQETTDDRCGRPLPVAPPRAASKRPRRSFGPWLGAVLIGLGLMLAAGTAAVSFLHTRLNPETTHPTTLPTPAKAQPLPPQPPTAPTPVSETSVGTRRPPGRTAPAVAREPVSVPSPEAESPSEATGSVTVNGDAAAVTLVSPSGGMVAVGEKVPPGRYALLVQFDAGTEALRAVREVTVEPAGHLTFTCSATFRRCIAQ